MDNPLLLLRNAEVYAPEDLGKTDLLICGGRIVQMGRDLKPNLRGLEEVDVSGLLAMPGFVDQHVHITGGGGEAGFSSRIPELSAHDLLSCGVTTVVGLLGTDSVTRSVKSLLAKVKSLREEGLTAYCLTGAYDLPSPTVTGSVKDDITYISEILGVKVAVSDHRCAQPTKEELIRLAAHVRLAALTAGKPGVVHMHTGTGKNGLGMIFDILDETDLPVTPFRPTHVENVMEDAVKLAKRGGMIDFTADDDAEVTAGLLLRAEEEGAPWEQITMSSDAGGSIPIWDKNKKFIGMGVGKPDTLLKVVRALSQGHGMPLEKALCLITRTSADGLNLQSKGRLEPGADGDVLLTDAELSVKRVYAAGRLLLKND